MTGIAADPVCHSCLRETFQRALHHEANYPPKWGNHTLDTDRYYGEGILSTAFMIAYTSREREYRCPPAQRVFCPWPATVQEGNNSKAKQPVQECENFLGHKVSKPSDVLQNSNSSNASCRKCSRHSCLACRDRIEGIPTDHKCLKFQAVETEDAAFKGLKRGKDYQICPSEKCERRIQLSDGCNHIVCMCGMQLCFICGQPATGVEDHWARADDGTGCPRYNQPGSPRAIFDGLHADVPHLDQHGPEVWDDLLRQNGDEAFMQRAHHIELVRRRFGRGGPAAMNETPNELRLLGQAQGQTRRHQARLRLTIEEEARNRRQHPHPLQSNPGPEQHLEIPRLGDQNNGARPPARSVQRLRRHIQMQNAVGGQPGRSLFGPRTNDEPPSPNESLENELDGMRERAHEGSRRRHAGDGAMAIAMNPADFHQQTRQEPDQHVLRQSASPNQDDHGASLTPTQRTFHRLTANVQAHYDRRNQTSRGTLTQELRRFATDFSLEGRFPRPRPYPESMQTDRAVSQALGIMGAPPLPEHSLEPNRVSPIVRQAAASRNPPAFARSHVFGRNAQAAILNTNQYRQQVVRAAADRDRALAARMAMNQTQSFMMNPAADDISDEIFEAHHVVPASAPRRRPARSPRDSASPEKTDVNGQQ